MIDWSVSNHCIDQEINDLRFQTDMIWISNIYFIQKVYLELSALAVYPKNEHFSV